MAGPSLARRALGAVAVALFCAVQVAGVTPLAPACATAATVQNTDFFPSKLSFAGDTQARAGCVA